MGEVFAKTILEFNNFKMHKIVQTQIEQFYKQGGGIINHNLTADEKKILKKADKDTVKKGKKPETSGGSR